MASFEDGVIADPAEMAPYWVSIDAGTKVVAVGRGTEVGSHVLVEGRDMDFIGGAYYVGVR